jgi:hypothetical protein
MRRRAAGEKERSSDKVEFLDEDDQERVVKDLQEENDKQQEQMQRVFGVLCAAVAIISMLTTLLVHRRDTTATAATTMAAATGRQLRWIHATLATWLDLQSPSVCGSASAGALFWKVTAPAAASFLVAGGALYYARKVGSEESIWLHYGLLANNAMVLVMAFALRWDREATNKALQNLKKAKYNYKSL